MASRPRQAIWTLDNLESLAPSAMTCPGLPRPPGHPSRPGLPSSSVPSPGSAKKWAHALDSLLSRLHCHRYRASCGRATEPAKPVDFHSRPRHTPSRTRISGRLLAYRLGYHQRLPALGVSSGVPPFVFSRAYQHGRVLLLSRASRRRGLGRRGHEPRPATVFYPLANFATPGTTRRQLPHS